ncbi:MAG: M67 family metallopeptidase [Clostridiales Family XIII bacterium]|jgi:proteasome lid subunit RPN8/RPN11|nr:M67 family metallopeptidase [Clostridiales Family XIII bacterium]
MISIKANVKGAIELAGERDYPNETCGFVLGHIDKDDHRLGDSILEVTNSREEAEAYHRFVITPEDFLRAERKAASDGKDIVGIYHSHPDHPAEPSQYDLDHGLPFYSYIIVSVTGGKADKTTSWRLENDRSRFIEEELTQD